MKTQQKVQLKEAPKAWSLQLIGRALSVAVSTLLITHHVFNAMKDELKMPLQLMQLLLIQHRLGKKHQKVGPTLVLVVRGLDENADEEMLHYEFSQHAPIKDFHLVHDKFTHVSKGFAFVHFHLVEEATKELEATNGHNWEKNGQVLKVAFEKSIHGPDSSTVPSQSSSLAVAAIDAATFSQQYDSVGWEHRLKVM